MALSKPLHIKPKLKSNSTRFASTNKDEMEQILRDKDANNTQRATKSTLNIFAQYLDCKNQPLMDDISTDALPQILMQFYTDLRKEDGDLHKLSSLKCIRAGLNRHFKKQRKVDIISDPRFVDCSDIFKGVAKKCKKDGKGLVKSYPSITPDDIVDLGEYFDHDIMNEPKSSQTPTMCHLLRAVFLLS